MFSPNLPSCWAQPCSALWCYCSRRWSASQRRRRRNCRGEENKRNNRQSGMNHRPLQEWDIFSLNVLKMHTYSMAPHSLLAAESEDTTDVNRLPAEVPAVQTDSYRPVVQFTQSQGHGAEVQQTTTDKSDTRTHFIIWAWNMNYEL